MLLFINTDDVVLLFFPPLFPVSVKVISSHNSLSLIFFFFFYIRDPAVSLSAVFCSFPFLVKEYVDDGQARPASPIKYSRKPG